MAPLLLLAFTFLASQSYVPPPPPPLPAMLSKELVAKGQHLFEGSVWIDGHLEIHNYLGTVPCASCHDEKTPLRPEKLAAEFKDLPAMINNEMLQRTGGAPLSPQDPAMEALVQYLIHRYQLHDYKLSK